MKHIIWTLLFLFCSWSGMMDALGQPGGNITASDIPTVITSTTTGGNWNDTGTWIGGVIPTSEQHVIITGPVIIVSMATSVTIASVTVEDTGVLMNTAGSARSLNVTGTLVNEGVIQDNPDGGSFTVNLFGDLDNSGTLAVSTLRFSGSNDQYIASSTPINVATIGNNKTDGEVHTDSEIIFEQTHINFSGRTLKLNHPLFLTDGATLGIIHLDGQGLSLHGSNGAEIRNGTVLTRVNLADTLLIYTWGVDQLVLDEEVVNIGVLQHRHQSGTPAINVSVTGTLVNEGVIQDNPDGGSLTVNLFGDMDNSGTLSVGTLRFSGSNDQFFASSTPINVANLTNNKTDGEVYTDSEIIFEQTIIDFTGKTLKLSHPLFLTDGARLERILLDGQGHSLHGSNGAEIRNGTVLTRVNLADTLLFYSWGVDQVILDEEVLNIGVLQHRHQPGTPAINISVTGTLVNEGVIRDNPDGGSLTLNIYQNVENRGIWQSGFTNIAGEEDQFLFFDDDNPLEGNVTFRSSLPTGPWQWMKNDQPLADATQANLIFNQGLNVSDRGFYHAMAGETESRTIAVLNVAEITAAFSADIVEGGAPLVVAFSDESTGDPMFWTWDFGDGNFSEVQNPVHTYEEPGVYSVTLFVSNGWQEDHVTLDDYITVTEPELSVLRGTVTSALTGQPVKGALVSVAGLTDMTDDNGNYFFHDVPFAGVQINFTADVTSGIVPLETQFTSDLREGFHTITVSTDGYADFVFNGLVVETGETIYNLSLTPVLVDADLRFVLNWGATPRDLDSHMKTPDGHHVFFSSRGSATSAPYVTLDVDVTNGYGPETITVYQLMEGTYHYYVYNWSGEAAITASQAVVQIYDREGLLNTIEVPVSGDGRFWHVATINGQTGRIELINRIEATAPGTPDPQGKIMATKPDGPAAVSSVLSNDEPDEEWTYFWSFGDGSTSEEAHPVHTYTMPGVYTVSVTASKDDRATISTRRDYIHAIPMPLMAAFSADVTEGEAPLEVAFTDESEGEVTAWAWDFGDGNFSEEQNPVHTYQDPGVYSVALYITDGLQVDSLARFDYITVNEPPGGTVTGRVTNALNGEPVAGALVLIADLETLTDDNGFYEITGVREAGVQVTFTADITSGFAPLETQFTGSLREGYHTITVTMDGFLPFVFTGLAVGSGETVSFDLSLSPELDAGTSFRFVLNWGATPRDLDSHMKTPDGFHVYYASRGNAVSAPFVTLDVDVTSGYGPETITVYELQPGIYQYFVYNWSNEAPITTSDAVVQIYDENGLLHSLEVPQTGEGRYWNVAQLDGNTGHITLINTIVSDEPGTALGKIALLDEPGHPAWPPKPATVVPGTPQHTGTLHTGSGSLLTGHNALSSYQTTEEAGDWAWFWEFGDGSTSDEPNPLHTYQTPGIYSVTVTVSSETMQAASTRRNYIEVLNPVTDIEAVDDTVYVRAGNIVRVNPMDNDVLPEDMEVMLQLESWLADYGMLMPTADGLGFIYASASNVTGVDIIPYSIVHPFGSVSAHVYIHVIEGTDENQAPIVALPVEVSILEDHSMAIPLDKLVFDDRDELADLTISAESDNPAVHTRIDMQELTLVIHADEDWWGAATVTLTATDTEGASSSDYMVVTFIPVNDPPVALFRILDMVTIDQGIQVTFEDQSHDDRDPEGAVVAWFWEFGDGAISHEQHPQHVYTENGEFMVELTVTDNASATATTNTLVVISITSAEYLGITEFRLHGNYPNPFNPGTKILFDLPETGPVQIEVFNAMGQKVSVLKQETMPAGRHSVEVDATRWASGIYLYTIRYADHAYTRKMTLVK